MSNDKDFLSWQVSSEVDYDSGLIKLRTEIMKDITYDVLSAREEHIRDSLIKLGWTPPNE